MTREELAGFGLTEEQVNAVMESHGKAIGKLQNNLATAKSETDTARAELSKYQSGGELFIDRTEYENLKAENGTLKAEKENADYIGKLATAGVAERYRKFVLSELKEKMTEGKDFEEAMTEYLSENEQFKEQTSKPFKTSTQVPLTGGGAKNPNERMNNFLRRN